MKYTIAAVPTTYQGTVFRSRLEARWAAMFDLLHWTWVYEPIDLGFWSPDFYIDGWDLGSGPGSLLVEVKPFTRPQQFDDHPSWRREVLYGGPMDTHGVLRLGVNLVATSLSCVGHPDCMYDAGFDEGLAAFKRIDPELESATPESWGELFGKASESVQYRP